METRTDHNFLNVAKSESALKENQTYPSPLMRLFENELRDMYWAERAMKKAIPRMIEYAISEELVDTLDNHYAQTKMHIMRLEHIFKLLGKSAVAEKCSAMEGLIKESENRIRKCEKGAMRDAGIISAAQKIEHYEIAAYGTLCQFAKSLKLTEIVNYLEQILREEKTADDNLTIVAVYEVNVLAVE